MTMDRVTAYMVKIDECFCESKIKGIAKGSVKNRNKGGVSVCLRVSTFAHFCSCLFAFAPLRLLAFVRVCLRLLAFARICLRPPLLRPPLCDTERLNSQMFRFRESDIDRTLISL